MAGDKLHKVLAVQGHGSRREVESWIRSGRVLVNGIVAHVGQRVGLKDQIKVDGREISSTSNRMPRVLIYNKPAGKICTRKDPEQRPTVFDDLPSLSSGRWVSIGRLDYQSTGLLLFTNDGVLAHRMMHPATGLDREYAVRVDGMLTSDQELTLQEGVVIEGEKMGLSDLRYYNGRGTNHWYHAVLLEGRNREIRRLFESIGFKVTRLKRVRFGPVILPSAIKRGQVLELGSVDSAKLYNILNMPNQDFKKKTPQRSNRLGKKRFTKTCLIPYPQISLSSPAQPD